jgi:hypothetical protein
MNNDLFFFGCRLGCLGHHLIGTDGLMASIALPQIVKHVTGKLIDGGFCIDPVSPHSQDREPEGLAKLTHLTIGLEDWTVLAWWDRSGDTRYASNSGLWMRGHHTYGWVLENGKKFFPALMKRSKPVTLVETDPPSMTTRLS